MRLELRLLNSIQTTMCDVQLGRLRGYPQWIRLELIPLVIFHWSMRYPIGQADHVINKIILKCLVKIFSVENPH